MKVDNKTLRHALRLADCVQETSEDPRSKKRTVNAGRVLRQVLKEGNRLHAIAARTLANVRAHAATPGSCVFCQNDVPDHTPDCLTHDISDAIRRLRER